MARPFTKLRAAMLEYGDDQNALAVFLRLSPSCVSDRFRAAYPWRLDEMYDTLDRYDIPHEKLHEYFPKNGQNERGASRMVKQRVQRASGKSRISKQKTS